MNSFALRRQLAHALLFAASVPFILSAPAQTPAAAVTADFGDAVLETWVPPQYPESARKAKQEGDVLVEFVVEADGTVSRAEVKESPADVFKQPALEAVKQWHFKPALEDAKPAASALRVQVVFDLQRARQKVPPAMPPTAGEMPVPQKVEAAHATTAVDPEYPAELEELRLPGLVRIRITVDPEGVARQPQVLFASHPAFVESALRAIERAQFAPTRQGPLVRAGLIEYPVGFQSFGAKTDDILAGNHLERLDGGAGRFIPVVMNQPVYPRAELLAGTSATVAAEFTVTAEGFPRDIVLVDGASGVFADALRAAIESWIFQPERGSEPGPCRFRVTHEFVPSVAESRLAQLLQPDGGGIKGPSGLDQKLKPLWRGFPVYPQGLLAEHPKGRALVEFVIDRAGRARMPSVVEASAPEFGWAAVTAVSQWVFERPLRGGQPVDVLVKIPVEFEGPRQ